MRDLIPMSTTPRLLPFRSAVTWGLAALCAAAGLLLAYGFHRPVLAQQAQVIRIALVACLGLFALSRLLLLFPASMLRERLARWWVDFALLAAAIAWWLADPAHEPFILHVGAAYVLVVGAATMARGGLARLCDDTPRRSVAAWAVALIGMVFALAVLGGTVLTLPVCARGDDAVETGHPLEWYQLKVKWLGSTFTAAGALTGTGLTVQDIGRDYNRVGQTVVLVLMQIGGLGVLAIGAILGMRFRGLLGWSGIDDDCSARGLRRMVGATLIFALCVEAAGAVAIYRMWDPAVDLNFGTALREPERLGQFARTQLGLGDRYDEARLFAAVFHSVSAFCDAGLTLSRDGYLAYRSQPAPLLALLPLAFLGSLGGPVVIELIRRMTRRNHAGLEALSRDAYVTLGGSLAVLLIGAGLLVAIESTRDYQPRYPRERTPGRLMAGPSPTTQPLRHVPLNAPLEFSATAGRRAEGERLHGMEMGDRVSAALFQAEAARTGGAKSVRLDEASLSPASHLVLAGLMLVGGGVGGAAGGIHLVAFWLLLGALWSGGRPRSRDRARADGSDPLRATMVAVAIAASLALLSALVTLVLLYRDAGSPLASAFEAISACCNVGLSMGLSSELSLVGQVTLILGMLAGRLLPIIILLRILLPDASRESLPASRLDLQRPLAGPSRNLDEDSDAPIPLE